MVDTLNISWCYYQWLLVLIQIILLTWFVHFYCQIYNFSHLYGDIPLTLNIFCRCTKLPLWSSGQNFRRVLVNDYLGTLYPWKKTGWIVVKLILSLNVDWSFHLVYDLFKIWKRRWVHAHLKIRFWLLFSTSFFWLLEILSCWVDSKWMMRSWSVGTESHIFWEWLRWRLHLVRQPWMLSRATDGTSWCNLLRVKRSMDGKLALGTTPAVYILEIIRGL